MRKSLILVVTMLFLAVPAMVSAALDRNAATDGRGFQALAGGQAQGGNILDRVVSTGSAENGTILLAKRGGHHGGRGRHGFRGHRGFRGHHGFRGHNFGRHHGFRRQHFGHRHFGGHRHHFGFGFYRPFFNRSTCYSYSPFYGYSRLPYSYCYYR